MNPYSDDISHLEAARRYSNVDLARYHQFNPNGLRAQWRELGDRLLAFGRGYLAYGDTGFIADELDRLADYRRQRVNHTDLCVILGMVRDTIEKGEKFLLENAA